MKKFLIFTLLTILSFGCSKEQVTLHEELNITEGESLKIYLENTISLFAQAQYNISKQSVTEKSETINLLRRIQETNTIDEEAMLILSKLYGFKNSQNFISYSENLQKIQLLILEEFPQLKDKNQQELSAFIAEYITKEKITFFHASSEGAIERKIPGFNLDDLTCTNELQIRYNPDTPLSDFVCPNGANFIGCWDTWKLCVSTQAAASLSEINVGCAALGIGTVGLTATIGSVVPGVGTAVGLLVGLANGTAAFIFCAVDLVDTFQEFACAGCQQSFDDCCIME